MNYTSTQMLKKIKQGFDYISDNAILMFCNICMVATLLAIVPARDELTVLVYVFLMMLLIGITFLNVLWELYIAIGLTHFRPPKSFSKFFFQPLLSVDRYEEFQSALWEMREDLQAQSYSSRQIRWKLFYQKIGMFSFIIKERFRKFLVNRKTISHDNQD